MKKLKQLVFFTFAAVFFAKFNPIYSLEIQPWKQKFRPTLPSILEESILPEDMSVLDVSFEQWRHLDLIAEQLIEIIQAFTRKIEHWIRNEELWAKDYDQVDIKIRTLLQTATGEIDLIPTLPHAATLFVPHGARIVMIGDLHARYDTLDVIIQIMIRDGLMDENFVLADDVYFIGFGDYCDRGGMTWKTVATLLFIFLRNPDGRVFLIRGNHEKLDKCIQYYNLVSETYNTVLNGLENWIDLSHGLYQVFELLPSAVYLGHMEEGDKKTKMLLLSHGGVETRYNPTDLLNKDVEELREHGGVRFDLVTKRGFRDWHVRALDLTPLENWIYLCYEEENLVYQFWWNDLNAHKEQAGILPNCGRGNCGIGNGILKMTRNGIKKLLSSFNSETIDFVGSIHGHQHYLAKGLFSLLRGGGFYGCGHVLSLATPSIIAEDDNGFIIFYHNYQTMIWDNFSVIKIISGSIYNNDHVVAYPPTFLRVRYDGERWLFTSCYGI